MPRSTMSLRIPTRPLVTLAATLAGTLAGCGDEGSVGLTAGRLGFESARVSLAATTSVTTVLRNRSGDALGPITIGVGPVMNGAGLAQTGASLVADPAQVATLGPGASAVITFSVEGAAALSPGAYATRVVARVDGTDQATLDVEVAVVTPRLDHVGRVTLTAPTQVRRGDVVRIGAVALDTAGVPVPGAPVQWTLIPDDAGWVAPDGRFVAYRTGAVRVVARVGPVTDTASLTVTPRDRTLRLTLEGEGLSTDRYTSDLWVHGSHAYTGTWGLRAGPGGPRAGNLLRSWRLEGGGAVPVGSVVLDARTTNDVKVSADGFLGAVTHEGSDDGRNGVTLFELSDPGQPRVVSRTTAGLESGVHNTWIDGNWLYLVLDGIGSGLRILDIADPSAPRIVASFWAGESFLHDVIVRDGLAFLSHWDAGLVILDVGHGVAGGSPRNPVEVSRLRELGGETHNVWYWPERGYAFVGEEDFGTPGRIHVVDVSNLRTPREVATFASPGATPHNVWLDPVEEILYVAWYNNGVRAIDVSGELLGELDRQGRELASWVQPGEPPVCWQSLGSCAWAPQLHQGRLYVSDLNRGLVVLRPSGS